MAKAKERMQALVTVDEQPYEVPENWRWVRLGALYDVNPKVVADNDMDAAFVPMEKIAPGMVSEFTYDIQPWEKAKKGHTTFADGDVAFAKISPCFENRKSMILDNLPNGIGGGTTELIILRNPKMDQKYTFWMISTDQFISGGCKTYSGTVGQQRISMDYVKSYPVPVPPLPEQRRIVERIESLFAKLDEAKQKAQTVVDGFESRKAAILHKAFSGELTEEWRKHHNIPDTTWVDGILGDYATNQYGYTEKASEEAIGPHFLRITDIQDGKVDWKNVPYCRIDDADVEKYQLQVNDIVVARIGATTGKSYKVVDEVSAVFASYLIRVTIFKKECLDSDYLYAFLQSPSYWAQISELSQGIALPGVNGTKLKIMALPIPSLPEQREIVRILDSLLSREQQAHDAALAVLDRIDEMKKAILAKAFRGQLGTKKTEEIVSIVNKEW